MKFSIYWSIEYYLKFTIKSTIGVTGYKQILHDDALYLHEVSNQNLAKFYGKRGDTKS